MGLVITNLLFSSQCFVIDRDDILSECCCEIVLKANREIHLTYHVLVLEVEVCQTLIYEQF